MAAPTNINAATAVELGPLPNSINQQVDDAGTTYTVWYKITSASFKVVNLFAFGDLAVYLPKMYLYESDGTTPILFDGLSHNANKPYNVPIPAGVTYLKIQPNAGDPSPANLTISGLDAPALDSPPQKGDWLIPSDTEGIPAIVIDPTGTVREYVLAGIRNGEGAAILPNGKYLLTGDDEANGGPGNLSIYNADSTLRIAFAFSVDGTSKVSASDTYFYALNRDASPVVLKQIDEDGTTLNSWTITGTTISNTLGIAVSRDDTILYYATGGAPNKIKRWDLVNDVSLGDWYTFTANYSPVLPFNTDILVLSDDTILICRNHLGAPVTYSIIQLDTSANLLNTYTMTGTEIVNHLALNTDDTALTFNVWKRDGTIERFQEIQISDGTVLTTFDISTYESGQYLPTATATPTDDFGPPLSCPALILRSGPGTIICTKEIVGEECYDFDFQATGLEPTTFTLSGGDSQTFTDIEPGSGYGLSETVPFGWTSTVTVSNDSDPDNIIVGSGETVTVTFTNQRSFHERQRIIRRLRRAPHITQEDKRLFVSQFNLILQPGVGNVADPGLVPKVMLRVSHDAGHTWEPEQEMSAGELGHYRKRVIARQLGQARDLVFEVTVSDPVAWYLVEAFLDVEQGLH